MRARVEIENIEEMRCRQGIDDVELREAIRGLRVGDVVRLTFLAGAGSSAGETLSVRVTSIRGNASGRPFATFERGATRCQARDGEHGGDRAAGVATRPANHRR